jgi:hypothetical protein
MTTLQVSPAAAVPQDTRPESARQEITIFLTSVAALIGASTAIGVSQHVDVRHIEDAR